MVLNNSQYDEIMREYSIKQSNSTYFLEKRTAEVFLSVPKYKEYRDLIALESVNAAKASVLGDSKKLESINSRIDELSSLMEQALISAGYPANYLTPVYECSKCQDTGYINNQKCTCFINASINLIYKQSNIQGILGPDNFSEFSLDYYPKNYIDDSTGISAFDNAASVLKACKDFVANFPSGENILFYGNTGVGKTFLSNCIAREVLNRDHSVLYLTAVQLFDLCSKSISDEEEDPFLSECELLIIDDLGTELSNSFTNSKLFECINKRLLNGQSTIISTNFSIQELMQNYSERIFSRISSSYKLYKLYGDDIRFKKN